MVLERECLLQMVELYLQEEELKVDTSLQFQMSLFPKNIE